MYIPSNSLICRMIQQSFIDMENMFDLLSEEQEVSRHFYNLCSRRS